MAKASAALSCVMHHGRDMTGCHLQKACGSSPQPYMGVKRAPVLGPYRPTDPRYCLIAVSPASELSNPSGSSTTAGATSWLWPERV